jgi:hypothetical protein
VRLSKAQIIGLNPIMKTTPISTLLAAEFQESGQLFLRTHNETLSVVPFKKE